MNESMRYQPGQPDVLRHKRVVCPFCRYRMDASGSLDGKPAPPPESGNVAICMGCAQPAVYVVEAGAVTLRKPTTEELAECLAEPVITDYIDRLKALLAAERRAKMRRPS